MQGLADKGARGIAHAVMVLDGASERALYAIGPGLPGVFSDLPAIFAGDLAEDGVQVEQRVLVDFGACKMGSQSLMQVAQAQSTGGNLAQAGSSLRECGSRF